jgi:uncharacterized protein (TIGR03067 family)
MGIRLTMMAGLVLGHIPLVSAQSSSKGKETKEDKSAAEIKKLEGKWRIESAKLAGRDFPASPEVRWEFAGFTMMNSVPGKPETQTMRTITLDVSTDPKRITMIDAELKDGIWLAKPDGYVVRAVYALDGDKLTLVQWRGPKPEYPKSVTPKAGEPVMEMVLRRIKD